MATGIRASGGGRHKNLPAKNGKSSITRIAPPDELMGDAAIKLWKTQSKILIERGTFELEDAPLLVAYCNAFQLMLTAEQVILKHAKADLESGGITEMSGMGGLKKHPAVAVRNDSVSQIARLGSLLGLDPLSRMRSTGAKEKDDDGNEFDEF
ncbi:MULTISPECIES: phage terminase small subunit P27 family [Providencia]|uniref:phage terminase small subunit P27 family n=1 Tax=Providencia TaxID=586 RepID=UPI0012B66DDA|nr:MULTISPECIES: phage terminase small subunit P27 family [Providencia]MTC40965.1 phage terminase small subunit P27 family [Providencia sp. wls1921]UBX48837.1 phage terminase small subunit P27 family [Providencia alcalifaciens]